MTSGKANAYQPQTVNASITVVLSAYNRVDLICRALDSVLAQEYAGSVEIIVVDDGSSDGTPELIAERYPQVKLILQDHAGAPAARNRGMQMAGGEFIALLDSDDELMCGSLSVRVAALINAPEIDLLCSDYRDVVDGEPCPHTRFESISVQTLITGRVHDSGVQVADNFFDAQLRRPIALTSAMLLRRAALTGADVFDEALLIGQDWEYCLRFSQDHKVGILPEVVVLRYLHATNLIKDRRRGTVGQVLLDRQVLRKIRLTPAQHSFARRRLEDDLYEVGYSCWKDGDRRKGLRYGIESFLRRPAWKKAKLLVGCLVGKAGSGAI